MLDQPSLFPDDARDAGEAPRLRWPKEGEAYSEYIERMLNRAIGAWAQWHARKEGDATWGTTSTGTKSRPS